MLAALSACGPKIPTPTETADTFLTALKAQDKETLATTILSGKLADLTEKSYEKTAALSLSMKDDKWVVDEIQTGDDIVDALTGGLVTAFSGMEDAMSAWDEEE